VSAWSDRAVTVPGACPGRGGWGAPSWPAGRAAVASLLRRERRTLAWLGVLAGVAALVVLAGSLAFSPAELAAGAHWRAFGLQPPAPCPGCPFCGMSRAFAATSHGQPLYAWQLNPGSWLLYPAVWLAVLGLLPVSLSTLCQRSR